jgi:hypothetical protein
MASAQISTTIRPAYIWNGSEWVQIGDGGGGAAEAGSSISVSASAPISAIEGSAWFDNTDGKFYVYDGTFWVESAPTDSAYASYNRWTKVLSGSASMITGLDDNGVTLDYTPGQESLYINGIFIDRDSYIATSGSSIVLDEISFSGDVIELVWLDNISIADIANIYLRTEQDNLFLTQVSASNTYTTLTQFNNIDLTSTINTASAAAYASASTYTDSAIASFEALPNQSGNNGKYLTTNGTSTSWETLDLDSAIQTASAAAVTYLVDSAPGTLDTLNELSAALNDDPNFYSSIQSVYLSKSSASTLYISQSEFGYPVWNTNSGTLATVYDINSASVASVSAFSPLGGSVSFSSNNIPTGLTLSPSGLIYGNPLDVISTTVHNFDIYAQTNTGATNSRSFNIILNPANDGSSSARAATSATAIYDLTGTTTSGLYWILGEGSVPRQVYCDMTTLGEDGKPGFMLAGSWSQASEWTKNSTSTVTTLGSTAVNAFSAIFGNFSIKHMRVHVSSGVDVRGSSAEADWYYYWNTPTTWKTVWSPNNGTNSNYVSTPAINNGTSIPRISLKQFTYAKNLKYNYTVGQEWASLSDNTISTTQVWANWWSGLTSSGVTLGVYSYGVDTSGNGTDGSLALLRQGSTDNSAGQDSATFNSKYGYDDGALHAVSATSATYTTGSSGVVNGSNTNMWIWIK